MQTTPTVTSSPSSSSSSCPSLFFHPKLHEFPPRNRFSLGGIAPYRPRSMASLSGVGLGIPKAVMGSSSSSSTSVTESGVSTLIEYVGKGGVDAGDDLVVLIHHIQYACKRIAALVASPFNSSLAKHMAPAPAGGSDRDKPKPLDIVSNEIILSSLKNSGKAAVMASEEDDTPIWISDDGPFVVVTDPLDGSRNIDASIPTGTIFGIYKRLVELDHLPVEEKAQLNSLQSGTRLVAAGYVLYSSATIFCTSFGSGTHAFTLDHSTGDFILTHPSIKIPPRGQIYSVNDARYFDWPEGLRKYIDTVRQGKGKNPKKYSARYICSLVADLHRTLLYGGVAMNPRDHLRLVYEANPLSFLVEQAGGRGSDGKHRILSLQPVKLHQRLPLFLGSSEDMEELESYGDVQQKVNPLVDRIVLFIEAPMTDCDSRPRADSKYPQCARRTLSPFLRRTLAPKTHSLLSPPKTRKSPPLSTMIMGSGSVTLPAKRSILSTEIRMSDPNLIPNPNSLNGPSSKRSKKPAAQPLIVPPGHVAFRLLCHASRIGGVIGKSGSVIKQLQQATGSKIRVEDAPAESPDRVVAVVAPSALAGKVSLKSPIGGGGEDGGGGEEMEVSRAQEALLKVFDRILEVAAESGAVGVGGVGVVSCRLLADAAQAGSVIGKGGKVVEKIRKDSGSKIRVLTEKLPACAASTDEMIEIEGSVLAVKKALVAVSRRVQDCPHIDKTKAAGNRQVEAVPQESLPDLRVDLLSQRNPVLPTYTASSISLPTSSIGYVSGVRPLAMDSERVPTFDTKTQLQEISYRILCANDRVGGVIGKGGSIIRALQSETGATVSVGASLAECDERLITVTASENPESRFSPAQKAVVLVFSRFLEASIEKGKDSASNNGSSVTARLVVPSNQVGCLLGKGGAIVSEMRKVTGANIRVIGGDKVPKCVSEKDVVVQISGDFSSVQDALYNATGRLRDNLLSSLANSAGTRNASSLLTDTSPYGRMIDSASLAMNTSPPVGVTHSLSRHTTLTQGLDHLGLSQTLDRPPSPRPWESYMFSGVSARGFSDAGRGFTSLKGGLELGSGSKSAFVTNTTVEIVVPENVIGSVYGENGNNLTRLRQISGARVIVHEPRPGTSDRIIVISGTPDETQAAQSLLHAFILTGPS